MRALLIVNPQATSTTEAGRDVLAHALASDVSLEVLETKSRGHAMESARSAASEGFKLIIAHGGDGTVNEIVNGMLSCPDPASAPMLGVVPGGSANVFASALGLPRDPVEATHRLLRAIETGSSRGVGLGTANGRWFTFNAGVGWDADVVASVERRRAKGKSASPLAYATAALAGYFRNARHQPSITLRIPGEPTVEFVHQVFVSNTDPWTYLGNRPVRINPQCSFDDGIGVFALRSMRTHSVLRYVTQALRGRHTPHGRNLFQRANLTRVHVTCEVPLRLQVDGDDLGEHTDVEFRSVPHALRVAV